MTTLISPAHLAADYIRQAVPDFHPKVGIVLGSGLDGFAAQLTESTTLAYEDIPHFPKASVSGHQGKLTLGQLNGIPVICLRGRSHTYEGNGFEAVKTYVRTLHLLGCTYFITTNAAGSLHADMPPGELMLMTDHINLQGSNPLVGPNDDAFGPRFFALDDTYDKILREQFLQVANENKIKLHEGVYICVTGPNYETAAEIRAFKALGADAVGMSTVPEMLVATHCGMRSAGVSAITNFATGLASCSHSHTEVLNVAQQATKGLIALLTGTVSVLA
ncbi:MAG: purine-nucleoside phosphorylase [Gammaproteobacteria bacterium]|nr:purine-nucleoside phosphorylase [Gammaproteobacteria bacterium]